MNWSIPALKETIRETFSNQDERTRTQLTLITSNSMNGIAANLAGGSFFTGLLLFLDASTIQIGLVNIIAYVCNILQLFCPLFLERFETRKRMLVIARIINHLANIVLIGFLATLPVGTGSRVYMILGVSALLNIMAAFTNAGYSAWHIQSIPDRQRAHFFSLSQRVNSVSAYIFILLGSAIADMFRDTPQELTGYLILRAIAVIFAVADVYFLARIREYPYPPAPKVNLWMLFTEPLKAKRYRVSILISFLWSLLATTCGSYYTVYMLDTVNASYSFLNICGALSVPCVLIFTPKFAHLINRTSWFSVYWKAVMIYGLFYMGHPFVTTGNYHWMYPALLIILYIISPAINLVHANLAYHHIPKENQTIYLSFYAAVGNLASILGNLFATQFMVWTEGQMFNVLGISMHPGQFLPGITGMLIILLGVIAFFIERGERRLDAAEEPENDEVPVKDEVSV